MIRPLVLGITGASGAAYAVRLLDVLLRTGHSVHASISPSGAAVIKQELNVTVDLQQFDPDALLKSIERFQFHESGQRTRGEARRGAITYHHFQDYMTPIASGSFLTAGMVICPCSGSTLSGVVHGASTNLIQRAADVHLKERRRLILVPRETPLSLIHLENMRRACEAGAIVLPAMPGWYHGVRSLGDLIDFVVARILDQLELPHQLMRRWGSDEEQVDDV